jgi:beta-lactamase superfamily II metal-dependent hydrolase
MQGKIHFLNTQNSDCMILESQGHLAMVDAAEDNDYPADKPHLNMKGYEEEVVAYLLDHFRGEDGKVHLDFVLTTHCHSDHIGGFDTVINHPDIVVDKGYVKPYHPEDIFVYERVRWDNLEVYHQMLDAMEANGVERIESFDEAETNLGDFHIQFLNGAYKKRFLKFGENINSVGTLLTIGNTKAFLAGDINNKDGEEWRLAPKIGKVDLLKVGHHGYVFSSSYRFIKTLHPDIAVVCNSNSRIYPDVRAKLKWIAKADLYTTSDNNGVLAEFDGKNIKITTNIM